MIQADSLCQKLDTLKSTLQQLSLWEEHSPNADMLASSQPFALDTLTPTQWLQWVFIPKMDALIRSEQAIPTGFEISPYFEQAMVNDEGQHQLLVVLKQIDEIVK